MKSLKIFIVDDDKDFAKGLALLLELDGHAVELAFSGEEAVERSRERSFDMTFMDVMLPGIDGVESFFRIRKLRPDAKVVMMTAYRVEQKLNQALDAGALGILNKPFDAEKLFEILEGCNTGSNPSGCRQ